jgi:hypothetical protein
MFLGHFSTLTYQMRNDDLVTFATERLLEPTSYLRTFMLVSPDLDLESAIFASEITPKLGSLFGT